MILVEPDRLLIGADPQGIYEFPKPAKIAAVNLPVLNTVNDRVSADTGMSILAQQSSW